MRSTVLVLLGLLLLLGVRAEAVVIQGPSVHVATHQVTISWRTDVPSTTEILYGPTPQSDWSMYPGTSSFNGLDTLHSRTLRNLSPGVWYFRVRSQDDFGISEVSSEMSFTVTAAQASAAERFSVDANVRALAVSGNTLYVGGLFTRVNEYRGHLFEVDSASGVPVPGDLPMVDGTVSTSTPDGRGGFYIGGSFRHVGGLRRNGVARILPDGGVDPDWNPNVVGGGVSGLALVGNSLYLGGYFNNVGGATRIAAAAVDATTGAVLGWSPSPGSYVDAMAVSGNTVYFGGDFPTFLGSPRNHAAAVNGATGALLPWNPNPNGRVWALAVSGSQVYLGGEFTSVNGTLRNRAAAVDATSAAVSSWNPNANDTVYAVAASGASVYLGGNFSTVGGAARVGAASLNTTTGAANSWNPNLDVVGVRFIGVSGATVYLGGNFSSAGGTPRNRTAAVDGTSGAVLPWDPNLNASVATVVQQGSRMILGGGFSSSGSGVARSRVAAINLSTGQLEPWSPDPNGPVNDIVISGSTVYLAGDFTSVGGTTRNRLAAVDASSGSVLAFDPNVNGIVETIAVSGGNLILGGSFTNVGGTNRSRLASVNATTGALQSWNPNVSGTSVYSLVASGSRVFIGGLFSSVGGSSRQNLAAVDLTSGAAVPWAANANGAVKALAIGDAGLYVGGDYSQILGTARNGLAVVDPLNASLLPWNPAGQLSLEAMSVAGTIVYAVWWVIPFAGVEPYATVEDAVTGQPTSWVTPADFTNSSGNGAAWADCTRRRAIIGSSTRIVEAPAPMGCPISNPPAILDNQSGDDTWRAINDGRYDVDFTDDLALASWELEAWSGPGGTGMRSIAWSQAGALSGTSAVSDWALPSGVWSALPEGRSYCSVRVADVDGSTASVTDAFYIQKDTEPPTPPTSITVSAPAPSVTLSWPLATDATSGVAFYRLFRGPSPTGPWQQIVGDGALNVTTFDDAPMPGEHWYQVAPVDFAGNAASTGLPMTSVVISAGRDGGVPDGGAGNAEAGDGGSIESVGAPVHYAVGCDCRTTGAGGNLAIIWAAALFVAARVRRC
ncbi:MAG: fibronectin type III domain-containing protein [Myxococcaceae bacterium]